ncbi:MAG: hypothetical protein ACI9J3_003491 [Parvicellaceae bacterium]|jgi:hypothetical protein
MKDTEEIEKAHQLNRRTTYQIISLEFVSSTESQK